MSPSLVLVGNSGVIHVGSHLNQAACAAGLDVAFCDAGAAFGGPAWLRRLTWRLGGHRPPRLRQFSEHVVALCRRTRPSWLLATGLAPLEAQALAAIGDLGVKRVNYLTDDPWNPAHSAAWFLAGLPLYDQVFSPRQANLQDLRRVGCQGVAYLPFAYAPEGHFPEPPAASEATRFAADVVFVGGADPDRVPLMATLLRAGVRLALWGGYWERYPETRACARGHADPRTVRQAIGGAKVGLCLVRRANRDGHAMRTYEVAAIGACMLVEDTDEHRAIFGEDGRAVVYFDTSERLIERLRWLLAHDAERCRLARAAHRLIVDGQNTYRDRLSAMLGVGALAASAR
jgi:spore maturation protein CgeB